MHSLAFCLGVSPGMNRFPLQVSKSPFRLVARTIWAPQTSANLTDWGESRFFPLGRGLQVIYGNLFYPANLCEFKGIGEVFLDFPFLLPEMQTFRLWPGVASSASPKSSELTFWKGESVFTNK